MAKIKVDVDGWGQIYVALRRGLEDGMEEGGSTLLDNAQEHAEDYVTVKRHWTGQTAKNFSNRESFSSGLEWEGVIVNTAGHSHVVDRGLAPEGEIEGSNPSVQDLMPWVVSNLRPVKRDAAPDWDGSSWDPDLRELAEEYSPGYVLTAFAVKESIEEEGYPGIQFSESTEAYMRQMATFILKPIIESEMNKELRKRGLQ